MVIMALILAPVLLVTWQATAGRRGPPVPQVTPLAVPPPVPVALEPTRGAGTYRNTATGEEVTLVGLGPQKVLARLTPGPAPCGHAWRSYYGDPFRDTRTCDFGHRFTRRQGTWAPKD